MENTSGEMPWAQWCCGRTSPCRMETPWRGVGAGRMARARLVGCLALGLGAALTALGPGTVGAQTAEQALSGQPVMTLRATELRADKLANAPVLQSVAAGTAMRLISLEGGWALVEPVGSLAGSGSGTTPAPVGGAASPSSGRSVLTERPVGWVRASTVNLPVEASAASSLPSGREVGTSAATSSMAATAVLTLGVRGLAPRVNRHALIIGISRYADPATPALPGARIDKESATQMAHAMQVPSANIRYLQDEQATGNNIRQALKELTDRVLDGDRVFIHYSGHGTRYNDLGAGGCVEALLAHEGAPAGNESTGSTGGTGSASGIITNREMADLLKTITNKTDKLFVMYDACHSGGLVQAASAVRTRGIVNANDEGLLRPKFSSISEECGRPVNIKTRNLLAEATARGALAQDIIHVSASRDNEISFDDELKGGLATQFMRDCMLRDAKDLDNSGAISMDEIRVCAQEKINRRMANDVNYRPHNLVLNGNAAFVPAWFSQASATPVALVSPHAVPGAAAGTTSSIASGAPPGIAGGASAILTPPAMWPLAAPAVLTGEQALRQMFEQRDAKRRVQVLTVKDRLKVGRDGLDFSVQSDRAGFVYVALAGSDNKSVYLLFPNDLDQNNKIEAGQQMLLPRPNWRVKAAGPAGTNNLMVMVADGPRDLRTLAGSKAGPFVSSLNDAQGRARLGALLTSSQTLSGQVCTSAVARRSNPQCSDAYGASMFAVQELK